MTNEVRTKISNVLLSDDDLKKKLNRIEHIYDESVKDALEKSFEFGELLSTVGLEIRPKEKS